MTRHDAPWPQSRPVASYDRYENTILSRGFEGYAGSRSLPWVVRIFMAAVVIVVAGALLGIRWVLSLPDVGIGAHDGR
jgi:hypothetical protein